MDKDSEVTSDQIGEQVEGVKNIIGSGMEFSTQISEMNDNPDIIYKDPEGATKKATTALDKLKKDYNREVDYMIEGWHRPEYAKKEMLVLEEKIAKEKNLEDGFNRSIMKCKLVLASQSKNDLNCFNRSIVKCR